MVTRWIPDPKIGGSIPPVIIVLALNKKNTKQDKAVLMQNYSTIHICVSIKVHGAIFHVVLILLEETCSRTVNPKQYDQLFEPKGEPAKAKLQ